MVSSWASSRWVLGSIPLPTWIDCRDEYRSCFSVRYVSGSDGVWLGDFNATFAQACKCRIDFGTNTAMRGRAVVAQDETAFQHRIQYVPYVPAGSRDRTRDLVC